MTQYELRKYIAITRPNLQLLFDSLKQTKNEPKTEALALAEDKPFWRTIATAKRFG